MSFGRGVYFFGESPKSIQDVIGDVYCPSKYCFNREKCEPFGGYVITSNSVYSCGNCGVWFFVHEVPFVLQEHVKTTKTGKTRFFFAKKDEVSTQQTIVIQCPISINQIYKEQRKNSVWTTKYERLLDICFVQHVEMKDVSTFQPIKRLVSRTVKSAKPALTF